MVAARAADVAGVNKLLINRLFSVLASEGVCVCVCVCVQYCAVRTVLCCEAGRRIACLRHRPEAAHKALREAGLRSSAQDPRPRLNRAMDTPLTRACTSALTHGDAAR